MSGFAIHRPSKSPALFSTLNDKLGKRTSKKLAGNTYAERRGDAIAIKFHATDILTVKGNEIVVNSGGYQTATTKARLNEFLPSGFGIYQKGGLWYWNDGTPFADGDKLQIKGEQITLAATGSAHSEKADKALRKQVNQYAKDFAAQLPSSIPDGGCCWYCLMKDANGKTMGDLGDKTTHLANHMEDKYYVPSLLLNALKEAGNTDLVISAAFGQFPGFLDVAKRNSVRAIRKYILKRFGLPA